MPDEEKSRFIRRVRDVSSVLARAVGDFDALAKAYTSRGYGGANPITDADIEGTGLTAANMAEVVQLASNLLAFANGQTITAADYKAMMARLRNDL